MLADSVWRDCRWIPLYPLMLSGDSNGHYLGAQILNSEDSVISSYVSTGTVRHQLPREIQPPSNTVFFKIAHSPEQTR